MKTKVIGYWLTTAFLAFALLSGGVAELARRRENVEGMMHLGYPLYFITIMGVWKVLGALASPCAGSPRTGCGSVPSKPSTARQSLTSNPYFRT